MSYLWMHPLCTTLFDELSPIAVLTPLPVGSSINQSMEDIDEGIEEGSEGEHNVEEKEALGLTKRL